MILVKNWILILMGICLLAITSCSDDDDEPSGVCNDSQAENYDPNSDTSSGCIYARDKFLGDYAGTIACENPLLVAGNGPATVNIAEGLDSDNRNSIIATVNAPAIVASPEGTVDGNDLTLNDVTLENIPIAGMNFDITVNGTSTLSEDESVLSGTLFLTIRGEDGNTVLTNSPCNYDLTKQ